MMSVIDTAVPRAANVDAGSALTARTGIRHRETQVAWIMKAPKNFGGEPRMFLKRESSPSAEMRANRYEPTVDR
jgi:hypothetical protein